MIKTQRVMSDKAVEVFIPETKRADGNFDGRWQSTAPEKVKKSDLVRVKDGAELSMYRAISVVKRATEGIEHVYFQYDDAHAETRKWNV